jgi:Dyp-type peroxidase family
VELELDDIQGIILFGYAKLPASCFILLSIDEPLAARQWIGSLADELPTGHKTPEGQAVNIAFTYVGLQNLGLSEDALGTFSLEFTEGITTAHRQRTLGDFDQNDPAKWFWGGPNNDAVHAVLMLYASDYDTLNTLVATKRAVLVMSGWREITTLETFDLKYDKEHFGFRDGISEPVIEGTERHKTKNPPGFNVISPGEFILGYVNQYGRYTSSPTVTDNGGASELLKPPADGGTRLDLGRNGSYVVFRQLEQDVQGFWKYCDVNSTDENGQSDSSERVKLAAKMVGRWPSGTPFSESSEFDPVTNAEFNPKELPDNRFQFQSGDSHGYECPIGSHIRRSFPRDTITMDKEQSIEVSKRHRIMRRGREYGYPIDPEMDPQAILDAPPPSSPRGLYFICVNADIGRQFEFLQDTWVNNPNFQSLYNDPDPIAAGVTRDPKGNLPTPVFTVQGCPVRRKVENLPNFVTTRGGAYFFLPGISALKYLGSL